MEKEDAQQWLDDSVNDLFMDFLYYDRKEYEEMDAKTLHKLMSKGVISKEMMIESFTNKINEQYESLT